MCQGLHKVFHRLICIDWPRGKVHIFYALLLIWLDLGYDIVKNPQIKNQVKEIGLNSHMLHVKKAGAGNTESKKRNLSQPASHTWKAGCPWSGVKKKLCINSTNISY